MRVSDNCQITIPEEVLESIGAGPGSEVEFQIEDGRAYLATSRKAAFQAWLQRASGSIKNGMTTDEMMELTRGED